MAKKRQAKGPGRSSLRSINVPVVLDKNWAVNAGRYVKASNTLLSVIGRKMSSSGVAIRTSPEVPTFTADPQNPEMVVRTLRGQRVRGHFVQGRFKRG